MKIAVFSRYPQDPDHPRGGVEAVAVVLVRALARIDDLDVHVITLEPRRSQPVIDTDGRVTIHRLPGTRWPQLADILIGPGRKRLRKHLLALKPDVVHTHETYGLTLGRLPIPHVFTVHGFDHANVIAESARFARIRSQLWKRVERYGLARHEHIISITPYVNNMIEPMTKAHVYNIDNPVDERFFNVDRRPKPGRILTVGWISDRKNTLGSVQAFQRVVSKGADAVLVVAGEPRDAGYYQHVKDYVDRHDLGRVVRFVGHIRHDQLLDELAKASVFLLPSRQENAPMAIAEAMAAGVPVVTSNCCGMPFMVREGQTGFLIDPNDPDQIADRLGMLVGDDGVRNRMEQRSRAIAQDRFHPSAVAEKTVGVYKRLLDQAAMKTR